jgi:hypothetical protein
MSLEQQLEALGNKIDTLIGVLVANGGGVANVTAVTVTAAAAAEAVAAATGEKNVGGRPKTRYYKSADSGQVLKTSGVAPSGSWNEITKAEYDKFNNDAAKGVQTKPAAAETSQKSDDVFGDDEGEPGRTYTLDDVRETALKLRDTTSMDDAKAFIATFGVAKVAELPESKFADFITKANAKIAAAQEPEL